MQRPEPRFFLLATATLFAMGASACRFGGSSNKQGDSPYEGCIENKVAFSELDASLPDGRTARAVFAKALGNHPVSFEELKDSPGTASFTPNSDGVHGSLELRHNSGKVYVVESKEDPNFSGLFPPDCKNRIDLEVQVLLKSDDGAFAESWDTTLSETSEGSKSNSKTKSVILNFLLPPSPMNGSFRTIPPTELSPERIESSEIRLQVYWNQDGLDDAELSAIWTAKPQKDKAGGESQALHFLSIYRLNPR